MMGSFKELFDETTFNDNSYTMFIIATLITFRIITLYQKEKIEFHFHHKSTLMRDFLQKSNIRNLTYTPYFLALSGNMQSFVYMWTEIFVKLISNVKFERELFTLSDGGTIALDWVVDHEGGVPKSGHTRPILCMFSGLAGGNDNLYMRSMMKEAISSYKNPTGSGQGYKCVVVNFRGAAGVPMTSSKLYWLNTWEDIQEPLEYIYDKYSCDDMGKKVRNMYGYSVSLGGSLLAKYLTIVGKNTPLSGATIYVMPFNIKDNAPFFRKNFFKFYDFMMGFNFHLILKNKFEDFKKVMTPEELDLYTSRVMANKYSLMDIDFNVMIPSFNYKTLDEYYEDSQVKGHINKIKIPTFFLQCHDDPCLDPNLYPMKEFTKNEYVIAGFTQKGGHCGSFTGGLKPVQWFPTPLLEFLEYIQVSEKKEKSTKAIISRVFAN
eukprot:403353420